MAKEKITDYRDAEVLKLLSEAYLLRINNLQKSIELGSKALSLSQAAGNALLVARSMSHLSLFYMIRGEYEPSLKMGEEAVRIFQELKDEKGVADAKYNIAGVYYKSNNFHMGLVYLYDCLKTFRQLNDWHNISRSEKSIGTIYEYFGDQRNAVEAYENAIEAALKAGDPNLESNVYNPLSGICIKQGQIERALELAEKAIQIKQNSGDLRGLAFALYGRGKVHAAMGLNTEAERDYIDALGIHSNMGERLGLAMAYRKLGALYLQSRQYAKAEEILLRGVRLCTEYTIVMIRFKCLYGLYELYKAMGEAEKSLQYLEEYLREKEAVINTQTLKVIENYELIMQMESLEKETQLQREKAEIEAKVVRAEQAAQVKQEFLSTMSHEIRTPLNAVLTLAGMLPSRGVEEEDKMLDSIRFAANNLLYIVNDILDFSRLDSGKVSLESNAMELHPLINKIACTYRGIAAQKGLMIEVHLDDESNNNYDIDEIKLSQIMGNLISNAIKYTDKGQVDIELAMLKSMPEGDLIRFMVKDTGIGIPEEHLSSIFDSFTMVSNPTKRKQGGAGLGLAIVKKLVELYGSRIEVSSTDGEGSVFYFDLHLKKNYKKLVPPVPVEISLKGKRVLLAEDNPMNAFVATKLLSTWGLTIIHAKNGAEAVQEAIHQEFDFILMDIHMPEMNGYEATEFIRTKENPNRATPIFALTADITAIHEQRYVSYFNSFLWKPLEVNKLFDAMAGVAMVA